MLYIFFKFFNHDFTIHGVIFHVIGPVFGLFVGVDRPIESHGNVEPWVKRDTKDTQNKWKVEKDLIWFGLILCLTSY